MMSSLLEETEILKPCFFVLSDYLYKQGPEKIYKQVENTHRIESFHGLTKSARIKVSNLQTPYSAVVSRVTV